LTQADLFFRNATESTFLAGAQLHVRVAGRVMIDQAYGAARAGVDMTPGTLMLWMSAG